MTLSIVKVASCDEFPSLVSPSTISVPDFVDLVEFIVGFGIGCAIDVDRAPIGRFAPVEASLGGVSILLVLNSDGRAWRGV